MIFSTANVTWVIKSNRIRLARDVACKGEKCVQGRDGKPEGIEHFEDLAVEGNIVSKLVLKFRIHLA
jgi:hypothetical protein